MRILFTNDDGYDAKGLHAVADLFKKDHRIAVVAPDTQRSGFSHSITLRPNSLSYREIKGYDYPVYALSGTPVDCVKVGITSLFLPSPDLIVSGINRGRNLGVDILYSGTVSAALDAASLGYRAVALSLNCDDDNESLYSECARFFYRNFNAFCSVDLPRGTCININYPSEKAIGVKTVRMSPADTFVDVYDGDGKMFVPHGHRDPSRLDADTDETQCHAGYITVTPLTTDRTDHATLKKMKKEKYLL